MTEKETELRDRLGLTLDGPPELELTPEREWFRDARWRSLLNHR